MHHDITSFWRDQINISTVLTGQRPAIGAFDEEIWLVGFIDCDGIYRFGTENLATDTGEGRYQRLWVVLPPGRAGEQAIARELEIVRNTVRDIVRAGEASAAAERRYHRQVQALPRLGASRATAL